MGQVRMTKRLQNLDSADTDMAAAVMNLMAIERRCGDSTLGEMVRQVRTKLLGGESQPDAVLVAAQEFLTISDALNYEECKFGVVSDSKLIVLLRKE
ncbi:MAG: hypothetical protein IJ273_03630, partial [Alphaproteobacteria bacterium]|nr:hypothetical protein [Alphaproteobacteria bacterium]